MTRDERLLMRWKQEQEQQWLSESEDDRMTYSDDSDFSLVLAILALAIEDPDDGAEVE